MTSDLEHTENVKSTPKSKRSRADSVSTNLQTVDHPLVLAAARFFSSRALLKQCALSGTFRTAIQSINCTVPCIEAAKAAMHCEIGEYSTVCFFFCMC